MNSRNANGTKRWPGSRVGTRCANLVLLVLSLFVHATCFATTVELQWDAVTDPGLAGYKIHYQADSSTQPFSGSGATQGVSPVSVPSVTSTTISGLDPAHAYYIAVTAYDASGTESSYSNIVYIPEQIAPSTSITYPSDHATVNGTVSVSASASDNTGVTLVEFYVNGVLAASDTASPYVYSWNTSSLASGTYILTTKAYDAAGNIGQSGAITTTVVNDITAPVVSLTSPGSGATVNGTVAITASATDNVGVSNVEFTVDGILVFATNIAPYAFNWNTTSASNGSHVLTARAYDNAGNTAQSPVVTVTVLNDITAPTVNIGIRKATPAATGLLAVTAAASDNVGISRVEFYVNGALSSTATAAPYVFNWDSSAVSNGSYTLIARAYDAAGNAGQSGTVRLSVPNCQFR